MLDNKYLCEIKERASKATPGPWNTGVNIRTSTPFVGASNGYEFVCETSACKQGTCNARFISAARTDIPALIAEVERLQKERDAAIDCIPRKCVYCDCREGWNTCERSAFISDGEECLNWQWRGAQE